MNTRFDCPHCGKTLQAPERKAGCRLSCPKCGQSVTVPPPLPRNGEVFTDDPAAPEKKRGRNLGTLAWVGIAVGGVLVLAVVAGAGLGLFGKKGPGGENKQAASKTDPLGDAQSGSNQPGGDTTRQKTPAQNGPDPAPLPTTKKEPSPSAKQNPTVLLKTSLGDIRLELFKDKAPRTVENFLAYVEEGFYDGTTFHRVTPNFTVQGGGFEPGLREKKPTRPPIPSESDNGLSNAAGTVSMARAGGADSATTQFFVNVSDNSRLLDRANSKDGVGYCVFGRVVGGMDVVDRIKAVRTANRNSQPNVPVEDVRIISIRRDRPGSFLVLADVCRQRGYY